MEFEVFPYAGVGPIEFGMVRADVRQRLAAPPESFTKAPGSASPTDAFDTLGIHVHYDSDDRCEAVEFGRRLVAPTFRGQPLLGRAWAEIERWLRAIDPYLASDSTGLTSLTFGFGLYAPSARDSPHSEVEGVIVFRRGYYEPGT